MVDPIATSPLIQGYTGQRQRSQRNAVHLKGSIEGVGIDQPFTSKTFQIPVWQLLVKRP